MAFFFLKPKSIFNKVKISNRKKKLLELLRARNILLIRNKKNFIYNELLNKSRPDLNNEVRSRTSSIDEAPSAEVEVEALPVAEAGEVNKIASEADMNKYITAASKRLNIQGTYDYVLTKKKLESIAKELLSRKIITTAVYNDFLSANSKSDKLQFLYHLQFGRFDEEGAEEEKT